MLENPQIIGMDLEDKSRRLARNGEQLQSSSVWAEATLVIGGSSSSNLSSQEELNEWFDERCPELWIRNPGF